MPALCGKITVPVAALIAVNGVEPVEDGNREWGLRRGGDVAVRHRGPGGDVRSTGRLGAARCEHGPRGVRRDVPVRRIVGHHHLLRLLQARHFPQEGCRIGLACGRRPLDAAVRNRNRPPIIVHDSAATASGRDAAAPAPARAPAAPAPAPASARAAATPSSSASGAAGSRGSRAVARPGRRVGAARGQVLPECDQEDARREPSEESKVRVRHSGPSRTMRTSHVARRFMRSRHVSRGFAATLAVSFVVAVHESARTAV